MKRRGLLVAAAGLSAAAAGLVAPTTARAQGVVLAGRMGDRALLVIDGKPRTVAVGASVDGVKLLRWDGEEAELEHQGRPLRVRIGAPVQLGAAAPNPAAREIIIPAASGGHFMTSGSINGRSVQFMVDTGATLVSIGKPDAVRLGLDLAGARNGVSQTANGPVPVQVLVLPAMRVGGVDLANVGAVVMPQPMPFVLLGNSFLSRFQMRRDNDVMRLQLR